MTKFDDIEAGKVERAASMMRAIAHPIRLAILGYLSEGKACTVKEIHFHLNIGQSTASHHLGIMKDKGILESKSEGKNRIYSLKNPNLKNLVDCISVCACVDDE